MVFEGGREKGDGKLKMGIFAKIWGKRVFNEKRGKQNLGKLGYFLLKTVQIFMRKNRRDKIKKNKTIFGSENGTILTKTGAPLTKAEISLV
jgi:hypothetical protein